MCTCACTCMYTEVCNRELSSARQCSPPEVQPSGHGISFGHWLLPWQLWPLRLFCSCCCLLLFVCLFLNFVLFCLDMSLHMESKMIRPGETPRMIKNKCVREVWLLQQMISSKEIAPVSSRERRQCAGGISSG